MATKKNVQTDADSKKFKIEFKRIRDTGGFLDAPNSQEATVFMVPTEDVTRLAKIAEAEADDTKDLRDRVVEVTDRMRGVMENAYNCGIRYVAVSSTGKSWLFYKAAVDRLSL